MDTSLFSVVADPEAIRKRLHESGWTAGSPGPETRVYFDTEGHTEPFFHPPGYEIWYPGREVADVFAQAEKGSYGDLRPFGASEFRETLWKRGKEGLWTETGNYYWLQAGKEPVLVGEEPHMVCDYTGPEGAHLLSSLIKEGTAAPVLRKSLVYRHINRSISSTLGRRLKKDLLGWEIEAKFSVPEGQEQMVAEAKEFLRESGYTIPSLHFPYTAEDANIRRYYKDPNGGFKAIIHGLKASVVRKGEAEVVDPDGMGCILKRRETKEGPVPLTDPLLRDAEKEAECIRGRKAFWVDVGNRAYHVSFDCCETLTRGKEEPRRLLQAEVEFVGSYPETEAVKEDAVIMDIAGMGKKLADRFGLTPTTETKHAWAAGC